MSEELKPCPFCGADAVVEHGDASYWVSPCCPGSCTVELETSWFDTREEAIAAWNTRPVEDALRTRIAELETENERLRAALTPIAEHWNWQVSEADGYGGTNYEWVGDGGEAFEIAAAALASTQ